MSEVKVNKISPRSGTDVTLGDSGDTFTVPSGATIVNSGTATGFGGGKVLQVVQATYATEETTSSTSFVDTSLTVSITPSATSSKVLIMLNNNVKSMRNSSITSSTIANAEVILKRGATQIYLANLKGDHGSSTGASEKTESNINIVYLDSPSADTATTYTFAQRTTRTDYTTYSQTDNTTAAIIVIEVST